MTRRKLHGIKFGIRQLLLSRIGGVAFIAISSSLRVRTLAADIHFGFPVWPPLSICSQALHCIASGICAFKHVSSLCVHRKEDYARD